MRSQFVTVQDLALCKLLVMIERQSSICLHCWWTAIHLRFIIGTTKIHKLCASNPMLYKVEYLHSKYEASVAMKNH